MNGKLIVAGIIILIVIIGGYFVYTNYMSGAPTGAGDATADVDNVQVQDVTVGEGAEATPNSVVSVLYRGQLEDGTVFDSSEAHGNEPLKFTLGQPGLIPGFQIGVNGMKAGGERVIVIPPSLGYGAQAVQDPDGKVIIPANSNIIFNIVLVAVESAPAETPATPAQE